MSIPSVVPDDVFPNPSRAGWVLVRVECPHCGRTHIHGGPAGDWTGHRASDCAAAGYYLVRGEDR